MQPIFILDQAQLGDNIGMAARAMLNCGFEHMRLVRPRDGWPNDKARQAAAGADKIIDNIEVFADLAAATHDINHLFAMTGRARGMNIPAFETKQGFEKVAKLSQQGQKIAILFGSERSGLENNAIALADSIIYFALNPEFKSLNLSHAVMLVAFGLYDASQSPKAYGAYADFANDEDMDLANKGEVNNLYQRFMEGADAGGFFHMPELKPNFGRNLLNLLVKARLTNQETRSLHGLIRALRNAPPLKNRL